MRVHFIYDVCSQFFLVVLEASQAGGMLCFTELQFYMAVETLVGVLNLRGSLSCM